MVAKGNIVELGWLAEYEGGGPLHETAQSSFLETQNWGKNMSQE